MNLLYALLGLLQHPISQFCHLRLINKLNDVELGTIKLDSNCGSKVFKVVQSTLKKHGLVRVVNTYAHLQCKLLHADGKELSPTTRVRDVDGPIYVVPMDIPAHTGHVCTHAGCTNIVPASFACHGLVQYCKVHVSRCVHCDHPINNRNPENDSADPEPDSALAMGLFNRNRHYFEELSEVDGSRRFTGSTCKYADRHQCNTCRTWLTCDYCLCPNCDLKM